MGNIKICESEDEFQLIINSVSAFYKDYFILAGEKYGISEMGLSIF